MALTLSYFTPPMSSWLMEGVLWRASWLAVLIIGSAALYLLLLRGVGVSPRQLLSLRLVDK